MENGIEETWLAYRERIKGVLSPEQGRVLEELLGVPDRRAWPAPVTGRKWSDDEEPEQVFYLLWRQKSHLLELELYQDGKVTAFSYDYCTKKTVFLENLKDVGVVIQLLEDLPISEN